MDLQNYKTIINEEAKRFELHLEEGQMAKIEYILNNQGTMFLTHTEVPQALEGKGIGSKIISEALQYIEENNYKLAPLCPFVAAYLKRHKDWAKLLAPGFNV